VDVQYASLSTFAAVFLDGIVDSDLGAVAICSYRIAVLAKDTLYLGVKHGAKVAILIHQPKHLAVYFDDASHCSGTAEG
jgi:hypothetical protein